MSSTNIFINSDILGFGRQISSILLQSLEHPVYAMLLLLQVRMNVEIECHADVRVAEDHADGLVVAAAFDAPRGETVTSAMPILSKSSSKILPNSCPAIQEQEKIGRLFDLLDKRIATQVRAIERFKCHLIIEPNANIHFSTRTFE